MIPGRCRAGMGPPLANLGAFVLLVVGTQLLARRPSAWDPSAWSMPWTGDVILVAASLLFLGLGILLPLHAGVFNLGVGAQFIAGFAVASVIGRSQGVEPVALAGLAILGGAIAGTVVGVILFWLKWRFAVHEAMSGLLLGGALVPVALAVSPAANVPLANQTLMAGGILVLALGILVALAFGHILRASAPGFDLRIVGSNPLAAVAAGVDVELVQLAMLASGGACAGLTGGLELWTYPSVAMERWPLPLAFAGVTVAVYGVGSVRGTLAATILFALWLTAPGTLVPLSHPGWGTAVAALLVIPALWTVPRLLPDQGAPRALWRTRHRESY